MNMPFKENNFPCQLLNFDPIRLKIARSASLIFANDTIIYRTAELFENVKGKDLEKYAVEASICKIFGSETLGFVSDNSIQILGGYGFSEEYLPAMVYRDTRIDRIYEGTNEINRPVLYAYILRDALLEKIPLRVLSKILKNHKSGLWNWEETFK